MDDLASGHFKPRVLLINLTLLFGLPPLDVLDLAALFFLLRSEAIIVSFIGKCSGSKRERY